MKTALREAVREVTRNPRQEPLLGKYRGFEVYVLRSTLFNDGFRFALKGAGEERFQPDNLLYSFDEKFSLSGLFQRMDNFLEKGLEQAFQTFKANTEIELAEIKTVQAALEQEFPQKAELALVRENHNEVMRELKHMQNDPDYVSEWQPKTLSASDSTPAKQPEADSLLSPKQESIHHIRMH